MFHYFSKLSLSFHFFSLFCFSLFCITITMFILLNWIHCKQLSLYIFVSVCILNPMYSVLPLFTNQFKWELILCSTSTSYSSWLASLSNLIVLGDAFLFLLLLWTHALIYIAHFWFYRLSVSVLMKFTNSAQSIHCRTNQYTNCSAFATFQILISFKDFRNQKVIKHVYDQ